MLHLGTRVLETERLILRPFTQEDAKDMFENWASDAEVTRYLTWFAHTDPENTRSWLRFREGQYADPSYYGWCIVLRETGEAIGDISCVSVDDQTLSAEIGWVLSRRYWGQGLAPEAGRRVVDYLLDEVGFHRVWAYHDAANPKSGRALCKLGMRYEGTQRQSGKTKEGNLFDRVLYSILSTDQRRRDSLIENP